VQAWISVFSFEVEVCYTRKFGQTDEEVLIPGFGCMQLHIIGGDDTCVDEEKAIPRIHYYTYGGASLKSSTGSTGV